MWGFDSLHLPYLRSWRKGCVQLLFDQTCDESSVREMPFDQGARELFEFFDVLAGIDSIKRCCNCEFNC